MDTDGASSDVEIITAQPKRRPSQADPPARLPSPPPLDPIAFSFNYEVLVASSSIENGTGGAYASNARDGAANGLKRTASEVIVIDSDDDDEEEEDDGIELLPAPSNGSRATSAASGSGINRARSQPVLPSSEFDMDHELPELNLGPPKNTAQQRSFSTGSLASRTAAAAPPRIAAVPPVNAKGKGKATTAINTWDSDDDLYAMPSPPPAPVARKGSRTTALRDSDEGNDSDDLGGKNKAKKRKTTKLIEADKLEKAAQAALAKASKLEAKKREVEEKKRLREVNTLRNDRSETVRELTVHVAGLAFRSTDDESDEDEVPTGKGKGKARAKKKKVPSPWLSFCEKFKERMEVIQCGFRYDCAEFDVESEGAIRWLRICHRRFDHDSGVYLPLPDGVVLVVEEEKRVIFLTALELSSHVADGTLELHLATIKSSVAEHQHIFIVIHGLAKLFSSMENAAQASYIQDIRKELPDGEGATAASKRKVVGIGENQPDRETLELVVDHDFELAGFYTIRTEKEEDIIRELEQMTTDIGQLPTQYYKAYHLEFLGTGESKIVSGKDKRDTYLKFLTSIPGVTNPMAIGISLEYKELYELYTGWGRCRSLKEKEEMLVGIRAQNKVNGGATEKSIGRAVSKRIYEVFNTEDPSALIR